MPPYEVVLYDDDASRNLEIRFLGKYVQVEEYRGESDWKGHSEGRVASRAGRSLVVPWCQWILGADERERVHRVSEQGKYTHVFQIISTSAFETFDLAFRWS
jgi:hypothetical protein